MARIDSIEYYKNNYKVIIRNGEITDAPLLINLMKKLDSETTFLIREQDEFSLTIEQEEGFISKNIDSPVNLFLVAQIDNKIVGTCGVVGNTRKRKRHEVSVGIAIAKKYWGIGIGFKLMETAIMWSKSNQVTRIFLHVDTTNERAIYLYKKVGFKIEGTMKNNKKMADNSYRDGYYMALHL